MMALRESSRSCGAATPVTEQSGDFIGYGCWITRLGGSDEDSPVFGGNVNEIAWLETELPSHGGGDSNISVDFYAHLHRFIVSLSSMSHNGMQVTEVPFRDSR
jgi:hypothetical protein